MQKYDTVGIDLVAMSVNDCICTGGEPHLPRLHRHAQGRSRVDPRYSWKVLSPDVEKAEWSLTGGETAIMPDVYQPGDFDMAGFSWG